VHFSLTIHHLIALFCTVAGKLSGARMNFDNEINNLQLLSNDIIKKPFQIRHLASIVKVIYLCSAALINLCSSVRVATRVRKSEIDSESACQVGTEHVSRKFNVERDVSTSTVRTFSRTVCRGTDLKDRDLRRSSGRCFLVLGIRTSALRSTRSNPQRLLLDAYFVARIAT
jgi:hypothetical protein